MRSIFFTCGLVVATFFVFGPIQLYLANAHELWFGLGITAIISILCGIIVFATLYGLGLILPSKVRSIYALMLFGLGSALYLQANFLHPDYGVLDGRAIDWGANRVSNLINLLIWAIFLLLPVAVYKIRCLFSAKLLETASVILIGIQLLTTTHLLATTDWDKRGSCYLSEKNIFTLSEEKNIVVFILDTFAVPFMDEVLKRYPEVPERFADFTYYENMVAMYPNTFAAIPHILTGVQYRNEEPFPQYIRQSYAVSPLLTKLVEQGYDIGIYEPFGSLVSCKSHEIENLVPGVPGISDKPDFALKLYQLTAIKYFPNFFKKYVWMYIGVFEHLKGGEDGSLPYLFDDLRFYQNFQNRGLSFKNGSDASFRFYHLLGAHPPFAYTENLEKSPGPRGHSISTAKGALKIVEQYVEQLKAHGVYDKTMIMIMADHGYAAQSPFPILMIKEWGEKKKFEISRAPLSYEDLMPTFIKHLDPSAALNAAPIDHWREGDKRDRSFLYYFAEVGSSPQYLSPIKEYTVTGNHHAMSFLEKNDQIYMPGSPVKKANREYSLGTPLTFIKSANSGANYVVGGLFEPEPEYSWSHGLKTRMEFHLAKEPQKDLVVDIAFKRFFAAGQPQRIVFYANGRRLDDRMFMEETEQTVRFFVPRMVLSDNCLTLDFEYPNATMPFSVSPDKSWDLRLLGAAFSRLSINEVPDQEQAAAPVRRPPFYSPGTLLSFLGNDEARRYFIEGLSDQESHFTWSSGYLSQMQFRLPQKPAGNLRLELETPAYMDWAGPQTMVFHVNGRYLETISGLSTGKSPKIEVIIPQALIMDNDCVTITIGYPKAAAPRDLKKNQDPRILSVGYKSIKISEI